MNIPSTRVGIGGHRYPMDPRQFEGVASGLSTSYVGMQIRNGMSNRGRSELMERGEADEGRLWADGVGVGHRNFLEPTMNETNNGNCYFTPVFCESALYHHSNGSIFMLQQSRLHGSSTINGNVVSYFP
ncbi:hypothetical protein EVAR_53252_1 [Eumeta japonica]|uniref:Uncharacterized protein n=1 Tax=Eumeta variegata TaxID=151549 RepID=A0A4C1XGL0_EUMVA|nr:hypothetical protein EVAR_53252_1 [Eumeta japonica]